MSEVQPEFSVIVHIGAGKCGSSSLQASLTEQPSLASIASDRSYEYIALTKSGNVVRGSEIRRNIMHFPRGYFSSTALTALSDLKAAIEHIRRTAAALGTTRTTPILSCEAWINEANRFAREGLLEAMGSRVMVVLYVRPQVSWLNSAWWQWGAWSGVDLATWLNRSLASANWFTIAQRWLTVPGVEDLRIRLATKDIVADFASMIGCDMKPGPRLNGSLDGSILRLFQKRRELRPGPHDSLIDVVLSRRLGALSQTGAPWVIDADRTADLIRHFEASNKDLLELLEPDVRTEMLNDPSWWYPAAYSNKKVEDHSGRQLTPSEVEDLAVKAIQALMSVEAELARLRHQSSARAG